MINLKRIKRGNWRKENQENTANGESYFRISSLRNKMDLNRQMDDRRENLGRTT